jgi:hypothetical protein
MRKVLEKYYFKIKNKINQSPLSTLIKNKIANPINGLIPHKNIKKEQIICVKLIVHYQNYHENQYNPFKHHHHYLYQRYIRIIYNK